MSSNPKEKSHQSAFQFFQVARFVSLLLASVLITKSEIGQEAIGQYETYLLVATTLSFFWINGILTSYLRIYNISENKQAVIFNTFLILLVFALAISALLFIFRRSIEDFFFDNHSGDSYSIFVLYFFSNAISFLTEYIFLSRKQYRLLFGYAVFHLIIQTAMITAPVYFIESYSEIIYGLAAFILIKMLILGWQIIGNRYFRFNKEVMMAYRNFAPPLIISFFLGGISIYVDGIIVTHYFDKATFAVYQYGAREFPLSLLLANAFSATLLQSFSQNQADGMRDVRSGSKRLMHILFPISIALLIASRWLYPVIFNPQFAGSFVFFNIYMLLLIPRLIFPHSILIGLGKPKPILIYSLVEFLLNIVLSLLLLKLLGLQGIAYGTVIAFIVNKTLLTMRLRKEGISPAEYIPSKEFIFYSLILIIIFIVFTYFVAG